MTALWLIFGAISLFTLAVYGIDKHKARRRSWRIPEKTLLTLSILGGAAGGLLAMHLFHHKTKKWYFHAVNLGALLLHIARIFYLNTLL